MSHLGMSQLVTQPTRITNTGQANILDLIFTNDPLSINIVNFLPPFSTSDHLMIDFVIYYNSVASDESLFPRNSPSQNTIGQKETMTK